VRLVCCLMLALGAVANGDVPRCQGLQRHGKLNEAAGCYQGLTRSHDAFERAEGYFGLQRYDDANNEFRQADKLRPDSALVKAEWARLFHEHAQPGDAAKLYEEAIEADANYAPAYLGMARVLSENYDKKAVELAQAALQRDPKLFQGHEFLAYLALEDGQPAAAAEEAKKALALNEEALDGLAVLACIDWLKGVQSSEWMDRILKMDAAYGEAYAMGAHFFVINYRYEEAVTYYRRALDLNGGLWAARSQLGVNLLRLGFDEEAKQQLGRCYEAHFRDPETVNSLRLLDTLTDYQTFKTGSAEVRLNKKEAALLLPYIQPELKRAISMYEGMYKVTLAGPVRVEVYPNHDDFMVRTIGLPGQGGLLGVTFGTVVAIDSPSARPPGHLNWADTLWHELNHVYVISASNKLVPRWFAEGVAVHEEGVVSRDWGDRLTPDIVAALKEKKLLPVVQLDRGFVRPEYPSQVLVSYYEAGKICDYIVEKWGDAAILSIIHSYAARKTTAEAIESNLQESPETFDKNFLAWLNGKTQNTVQHFDEWQQGLKSAHAAMQQGKTSDALKQASAVRDYYPDYVGNGSAYELLADCALATGNKAGATEQLEQYRDRGGSDVETLKKLAQLEKDSGHAQQASTTLEKLNFIYPEDEQVHRELGHLLLDARQSDAAVREYRAALALNPADVAESHFELANALHAAHKTNEAKEEVLIALEAAPNFKPAQQLLLQLSQ
jgi:tetratricopeptide (TPR) repeat protein